MSNRLNWALFSGLVLGILCVFAQMLFLEFSLFWATVCGVLVGLEVGYVTHKPKHFIEVHREVFEDIFFSALPISLNYMFGEYQGRVAYGFLGLLRMILFLFSGIAASVLAFFFFQILFDWQWYLSNIELLSKFLSFAGGGDGEQKVSDIISGMCSVISGILAYLCASQRVDYFKLHFLETPVSARGVRTARNDFIDILVFILISVGMPLSMLLLVHLLPIVAIVILFFVAALLLHTLLRLARHKEQWTIAAGVPTGIIGGVQFVGISAELPVLFQAILTGLLIGFIAGYAIHALGKYYDSMRLSVFVNQRLFCS